MGIDTHLSKNLSYFKFKFKFKLICISFYSIFFSNIEQKKPKVFISSQHQHREVDLKKKKKST